MNYRDIATFNDCQKPRTEYRSVSCDVHFSRIRRITADSTIYELSFSNPNIKNRKLDGYSICWGFTENREIISPLFHEFQFDYQKYPDSIRMVLHSEDSLFQIYLKENSDKLSTWLLEEAKKRMIL